MPPVDRIIDAYPNLRLQCLEGSPISTNDEHVKYIVRKVITTRPDIVQFLPFQNKVDIWDLEVASQRFVEHQQILLRAMQHKRVSRLVPYTEWTKDGPVTRSEYVNCWSGGYGIQSHSSISFSSDDEDDDDEEDEGHNAEFMIYYNRSYTTTEARRVRVNVPNASAMTPDEIKDYITQAISDGEYGMRESDADTSDYSITYSEFDYSCDVDIETPPDTFFRDIINEYFS